MTFNSEAFDSVSAHVRKNTSPAVRHVMAQRSGMHPDDVAVDELARAMKAKLARAREKGRGGWDTDPNVTAASLSAMLREHVEKGDPRDVANFCMFLWVRGEEIAKERNPNV